MSALTTEIFENAASSPKGLNVGTVASPVRLSWHAVHEGARQMAGALAAHGIGPGTSVAVLAADPANVAPMTQALWMRRAALTMLQQPTPRMDLEVWLHDTIRAIRMLKADLVVVDEPFLTVRKHLEQQGITSCTMASTRMNKPIEPLEAAEDDVALRQLTSGSTGTPKAVEITHANFAAGGAAMRDAVAFDVERDVTLSWLPLSHDMGMVGGLCLPMQVGCEAVAATPDQFLRRPLMWAELISRHDVTLTYGPNFAYMILARVLERTEPDILDLSSLRLAINGGEPIDPRDLDRFAAAGARHGLQESAQTPCYGLAEVVMGATFGGTHAPIVDIVSREAITCRNRASAANDEESQSAATQHIVCVGLPLKGMDVRITRNGIPQLSREIGSIEVRGPAVASRYLTDEGFVSLANAAGWFDTGDLGYLDEAGRMFICGRAKDLIVLAGKNVYPDDIERAAATVNGVRKGCVIAVRVGGGDEREGFAVLAEAHGVDDPDVRSRLVQQITTQVNRHVGYAPRDVLILPANAVPKTASGKLCRSSAITLLKTKATNA
ncbi:fatty acyl-AMP ligase [Mycobacterium sp. 852002-40037_SCH5390672]|uniref:fatty acyl-AMP ligase n=1 Tax=Mycobacterium sp. 852002-40037_SCH5390672 TaxID=1834089 RepID=UPI000805C857|nr:fatty acyl-AMP ligase [Mycobacterium sp. 852002-40037_SCH5390672]OBB94640.1 long-chain fatty acid--CoA ligase [Mycobacterium sp. 852002-40037_SCH5390672]